MSFSQKASIANFGGRLLKLSHQSATTGCDMAVNVFLPPSVARGYGAQPSGSENESSGSNNSAAAAPAPVLIYLSGLTCTPDNCTEKGFFQAAAARRGIALVWPDTSPRGLSLPGEHDAYDFGSGAGFYLDATASPWRDHYRMETYLTRELPGILFKDFSRELDANRVAITGHSMGGHGALTLYLRHPELYKSVSAFAPIANPTKCPWGEKAFNGYLGGDPEESSAHDATELVKKWKGGDLKMLIDQGTADNFYQQGQLLPENFEKAVKDAGLQGLTLRYQEGYDHSYFFMSSFAEDHVAHAAKYLGV